MGEDWQRPVLLNEWTGAVNLPGKDGELGHLVFVLPPDYRKKEPMPDRVVWPTMGVPRGYILTDENVRKLRPIFTGWTAESEEITLYQHADKEEEIHILLPNGEMWVLNPGDEVSTFFDPSSNEMRVDVVSDIWTGQAKGTKWDTLRTAAR